MTEEKTFNKNILIAVDESENSRRAVSYVAQLLGGVPGFRVALLHIIPKPDEDYFPTPEEREGWLKEYRANLQRLMAGYGEILLQAGFRPEDISVHSEVRYCPSMAECILSEHEKEGYGTIVVGRRGLSRTEEFLFGSITNSIVKYARNSTVWVVE